MEFARPGSCDLHHQVVPTKVGYDRWAEFYDSEDNPLILLEEEQLAGFAEHVSGLTVADIGCGTGRHALRLAAAGALVIAVDFSPEMLKRCRAKPGAEQIVFLQHDLANNLPLADSTFDRIYCCLVVEHIADLDNFFCELNRLCKPGGLAVVTAMHPALELRGVQPRFIDAESGNRFSPQSFSHQIGDYVMAALRSGWLIEHLSEHAVDAALAGRSPRAKKYLGWPLLMFLRLRAKPG